MRAFALAAAAALVLAVPLVAQAQRELGAHRHGHGTVNLAIEGARVLIELEAPGADIVGFEHAPRSAAEREAVATATATLKAPLALFTLPEEAGCRVEKAEVELEGAGGHAGERGHGHGEAPTAGHTEFHAEYTLACTRPDAISTVAFPYFEAFPRAGALTVNVATRHGQARHEVTRDAPRAELTRAP